MSDKKKQFLNKIADKGYYIALILCAAAIGISGYLYYRNANEEDPSLDNPSVDVMNPEPTDPSSTAPTKPTQKQPLVTGRPVNGNVLMDYAMDCLCYNPTTRDWRVHDGIDIAAPVGEYVRAATQGTVTEVYEDVLYGTTVVMDHGDGLMSYYANLMAEPVVKVGDELLAGDVIGSVGETALCETAQAPHLHFAMSLDDKSIDPHDYMPVL